MGHRDPHTLGFFLTRLWKHVGMPVGNAITLVCHAQMAGLLQLWFVLWMLITMLTVRGLPFFAHVTTVLFQPCATISTLVLTIGPIWRNWRVKLVLWP